MVIDFERRPIRSRIEAALLDAGARSDSPTHRFAAEHLGRLRGTVVELGPGTGVNLERYAPGTRLIAIEPNPVMRARLSAAASRLEHPLDLEIRDLRGESLELDDESADAVVATLVLCGVDDPHRVVEEVRRVLRPGGSFVFIEHVVAPTESITRRVQRRLRRPHAWMFNGCRIDHDAEALLRSFDWGDLEIHRIDLGRAASYVRHQITGVAVR